MIDKIALIYIKDRKVLSSRSKGKDTYYLPGGKREGDETDQETLIREIIEMTSGFPEVIVFRIHFQHSKCILWSLDHI